MFWYTAIKGFQNMRRNHQVRKHNRRVNADEKWGALIERADRRKEEKWIREHQAEIAAQRADKAAEEERKAAERDAAIEATLCQVHFPPEHDLNPSFRYRADLCPECHPEPEPEIDFSQVVDVATALLAGGESNSDVAAYISGETGIPKDEALRILLGIKGKFAVKAE